MSENYEQLRKFTRELPVTLNDHELQTYGRMLAEKVREEELTEEKKKQVTKEWQSKINALRVEIKRIADARAKGEELRPVECVERLHGNVIEIYRLDRQEVVDTRPAELSDLQTTIPDCEAQPARILTLVPPVDPGPRLDELSAPGGDELTNDGSGEALPDFDGQPHAAEGTGVVRDDDGQLVGEAVETSVGDVAYVSGGEQLVCDACDEPIADDEPVRASDDGVVHDSCEPPHDDYTPPNLVVEPTFSATIGERTAKPKRERSKKANAAKKPAKGKK